jgi:hypothetical protein
MRFQERYKINPCENQPFFKPIYEPLVQIPFFNVVPYVSRWQKSIPEKNTPNPDIARRAQIGARRRRGHRCGRLP